MNFSAISASLAANVSESQGKVAESIAEVSGNPDVASILTMQQAAVQLEIDQSVMDKAMEVFGEMADSVIKPPSAS